MRPAPRRKAEAGRRGRSQALWSVPPPLAIARLVPAAPVAARVKWPDFAARTARIKGRPLSATILDERD